MLTPSGWFDWAQREPGPEAKLGYGGVLYLPHKEGLVFHSAEGYAVSLLALVHDLTRRASWLASNLKDGRFLQHYPVTAVAWTNGSREANERFGGIESEGVAGEPLTEPQITNLVRATKDCRGFFGWPHVKRQEQLWEHNEMTRFAAAPTACPSGRIPWAVVLAGLEPEEGDDMVKLYATGHPYKVWAVMSSTAKHGGSIRRWVQNGALLAERQALGVWPSTITHVDTQSLNYERLARIPQGMPIT